MRRDQGTATLELALIMPVAILLVACIVEFGRLLEVYSATNRLASQFAYSWSACSEGQGSYGSCGIELLAYTNANAISNVAPQLTLSNVNLSMFEFKVTVLVGGFAAPVVQYSSSYQGQSKDQATATAAAAAGTFSSTAIPGDIQSIVVVVATYHHSLLFFNNLIAPIISGESNILVPTYTVTQLKT
jgi:Flp pilus assembly protein TadG